MEQSALLSIRIQKVAQELSLLRKNRAANLSLECKISPFKLELSCTIIRQALFASRGEMPGFNVWTLAGLKRDEVQATACLAALLNPALSGALASRLLQELLVESGLSNADLYFGADKSYTVQTERYFPGDKTTRMDLVVEGEDVLLSIEVKVDALEGDGPRDTACSDTARFTSFEEKQHSLKQFTRIIDRTKKLAAERGKRWFVLIISRYPLREIGEANQITWSGIAQSIQRMQSNFEVLTYQQQLMMAFSDHIKRF